jgi:hypothetical protein
MALGPNYAITKSPQTYINELIVETEHAIRKLDTKIQNPYRFMAATKIRQIAETQVTHQQHTINEIKEILRRNDLVVTKADKNKAIVIKEWDTLNQKIDKFILENDIAQITKDPTKTYQDQIQQLLQTSNLIIEKQKRKYLINGKPTSPKLNVLTKTHKEGAPIRPVINSIQAPSYRLAKHLSKNLKTMLNLPNRYNAKDSKEVAGEISTIQTKDCHSFMSLDINDLYVNIPTEDTIRITKFWLRKQKHDSRLIEQTTHALEIILKQNYFQYNNRFYQPRKGIAMGSISSMVAEIHLQYLEDSHLK